MQHIAEKIINTLDTDRFISYDINRDSLVLTYYGTNLIHITRTFEQFDSEFDLQTEAKWLKSNHDIPETIYEMTVTVKNE